MDHEQPDGRRPLQHVDGLSGSTFLVALRLILRSVVLGSRASISIAEYLDTLVERAAATYLETGVAGNILGEHLPANHGAADLVVNVAPPPPPQAPAPNPQLINTPPAPPVVVPQAPQPAPPIPQPVPVGGELIMPGGAAAMDDAAQNAPLALPPAYGAAGEAIIPAGPPALDQHLGTRYYAVFRGLQVGVFDSWPAVAAVVNGVPGNSHRRFGSEAEATAAFNAAVAAGAVQQVDMAPIQVHAVQLIEGELTHDVHMPAAPENLALDEAVQTNVVAADVPAVHAPPLAEGSANPGPSSSQLAPLETNSHANASWASEDDDEYADPEFDALCSQMSESVLRGETTLKGKGKED